MKNNYEVRGEETAVFLNYKGRKLEAIIDTEDLAMVEAYTGTWTVAATNESCTYAVMYIKNKKGKYEAVLMHRVIMNAAKGKVIDHINHNGLVNKKINLRECKNSENLQNRAGPQKNSKSGVRGVCWSPTQNLWVGIIRQNGKAIWRKYFKTLESAEKEIIKARSILFPYSATDVTRAEQLRKHRIKDIDDEIERLREEQRLLRIGYVN
jgi:hypothetical protein